MSSESNYSFTTKVNGQDLFTVRGDSYDEFLNNLTQAYNVAGVRTLIDFLNNTTDPVAMVQQAFGATVVADINPTPVVAVVTPTATPTVVSGRTCTHGKMKAMQGVSARDGKAWRGYMCMAEKGAVDKCKNIYITPNTPEWHTFVAE